MQKSYSVQRRGAQNEGLDDKMLERMEQVSLESLSEVRLLYCIHCLMFVSDELDRIHENFDTASKLVSANQSSPVPLGGLRPGNGAITKAQASHNMKTVAMALMPVLIIFERHQEVMAEDLTLDGELRHKENAPLASIFGTDVVSTELAKHLKANVDRMVGDKQVVPKSRGRSWS